MIKNRMISLYEKWNKLTENNSWLFPVSLFLISIVSYGVFIFSLGFYWDDWSPLMLLHNPDKSALWNFYLSDRPFQSWTYYVLFPICKDSTFAWQLSAIFFRWTTTIALYYTFLKVFPKQKSLLQWTAVLFIVFPGFSDIYASVSFGSHFMAYTAFGFSLLTMVLAIKNKRLFWVYYPVSLILTAVHMLTMEYFVGLELLRPVLLLILYHQKEKLTWKTTGKVFGYWVPYLSVLVGFIYWRMAIYPGLIGGQHESNTPYLIINFLQSPIDTLVSFAKTVFIDTKFLLLNAWSDRLLPDELPIERVTFWLSILLGIVTILIVYFLTIRKETITETTIDKRTTFLNLGIGFYIILFGMIPVWSTLRQITKGKWSDRFDLAAIFGVVLIITTLLFAAIQNKKIRNGVLICLAALSIGYHIRIGNDYRKDFNRQQSFYKELSWRIPELEKGTALYAPGIPTDKAADYSYTMGINLLYESGEMDTIFDYWFIGPRDYSAQSLIDNPDQEIKMSARTLTFNGSGRQVVSIFLPTSGCLWVINPYYALGHTADGNFPLYAQISNPDLIIDQQSSSESNMSNIIDLDSENTWCYYFEKGDLAQSKGEWEKAVSYYEKAISENLSPDEGIERLPFLQSYAKLGNIEQAITLTLEMVQKTESTKAMLCQFWNNTLEEDTSITLEEVNSFYNIENCPANFEQNY